jgi:hypothetical protein
MKAKAPDGTIIELKSPANHLRKQIYKMSRASHTPIPFFLKMTIRELYGWIDSINEAEAEDIEQGRNAGK